MGLQGKKLGLVGGGAMGEALARGVVNAGLVTPDDVWVSDVRVEQLERLAGECGVRTTTDNGRLAAECEIIILAVKPYVVSTVLDGLAPSLGPRHTLISIAAGVPLAFLEEHTPPEVALIRVMPNTPCLVNEGASAFALGRGAGPTQASYVQDILGAVGRVVEVPEPLLDTVTGLSGSGPAYVYLMIEALSDGGVRMGLPRDVATLLAAQTLVGAARMVLETGEHPGRLKDMVTTPGGTTAEGLAVLEAGAVRGCLIRAVEMATKKSKALRS